jgi:hypothetical protein
MLDSPNLLNLNFKGVSPTNRQILNVFEYGFRAHANADMYAHYPQWMSAPPAEVALKSCYSLILGKILEALTYLREVNKNALLQLIGAVKWAKSPFLLGLQAGCGGLQMGEHAVEHAHARN